MTGSMENEIIKLPLPRFNSKISIEQALSNRRSVRHFMDKPISLTEISQILWAAQGTTKKDGKRTTPSAGATYPLEIYLNVSKVEPFKHGIYLYKSKQHVLKRLYNHDLKSEIAAAALNQSFIEQYVYSGYCGDTR